MSSFIVTAVVIIVGLGAVVTGLKAKRKEISLGGAAVATLATAVLVGSMLTVIPANTVAVPSTLGTVGEPLKSGLHLVAPWTQITEFSARTQELSMLRAVDEGDKSKDDSTEVIAEGGGSMKVDMTVRFSVDPTQVSLLFREAGSLEVAKDRFVRPDARTVARNVFGQYSAEEGYSTKRAEIGQQITDELRSRLLKHGLIIESVNVRDVLPEQQVLDSINAILQARNQAAQAAEDQKKQVTEAETRKQVAERDKQATITAAEGQAAAIEIAATAQAKANQEIAASLTPALVEKLIAEACAAAIAKTQAQVVNVCSGASPTGAASAPAATTVIVDGRTSGG